MTAINPNRTELNTAGIDGRAQLRQGPAGTWIVQDREDRRGGLFRDRTSALKFMRREFGVAA